jgi:superfamily II DNA helicase RecQ
MFLKFTFSLGINQPDVQCVIHLPTFITHHYQDSGHAGGDSEKLIA